MHYKDLSDNCLVIVIAYGKGINSGITKNGAEIFKNENYGT